MQASANKLQVIIASGPEDMHRATLGFAMALSALASSCEVAVFLAMRGTVWASQTIRPIEAVPGFDSINTYIDAILDSGGQLVVCSTCILNQCPMPVGSDNLREGITIGGLTAVTARAVECTTLTF